MVSCVYDFPMGSVIINTVLPAYNCTRIKTRLAFDNGINPKPFRRR